MRNPNAQYQKDLRDRRKSEGWSKIWIPSHLVNFVKRLVKEPDLWKKIMKLIESEK